MIIEKKEALDIIHSTNGKFFTVVYTKKDGTVRIMNCRLGVTKGVTGEGLKYDPSHYDLLPVYDITKKAYRMINLDTIQTIISQGISYFVKSNV